MKKVLPLVILGLFLLTNFSFAQTLPIDDPADLENAKLCGDDASIKDCVTGIFQIVFQALIYIAGALAVIMFVWAGIVLIFGSDSAGAKTKLIWGSVGLVIALVSYVLVKLLETFSTTGAL